MKAHSQYFRNNLRGIRELSAVISYRDKSDGLYILTQGSKNILTEDNYKLITQYKRVTYDNNSINRVNVTFNSELFNTICKSVQIETTNKIEQGTVINVRVGVYIEETEDYEFIDLGEYTVLSEPTYQVDTKSYSVIAYDKMYESMINYDDNSLEITYPITHKNMLIAICNKLGWRHQLNNYPNYDKIITEDMYQGRQMTYRDILNDLNKGCFGCLMFQNNRLILRVPSETGFIIEDADLKDTNINLSEKYGKVNSLYITDKGTVLNFKQDQESIDLNGETKLNIADNLLMSSHNSTFINDLFTQVDGLEYTIFDVDSTGLLVLDPLDIVTFRHDGVDYKTIIFNDDISIQDGLTENLFSEKLKENVSNYYARDDVLKKITDAYIEIDKANGQIVLKVDNDGKIVQVELKADPETGSEFNVSADNINFEGKEFNITTENMKITLGTGENKKELINSLGIMSTFIVQGNVISSSFIGGTCMLPLGYSQAENGYAKDRLEFDFVIPKGFVVDKAYVTLNHMPSTITYDYGSSKQGYCRNMRLYKATSYNNGRLLIDLVSNSPIGESGINYQSISNIFNGTDFSGNNNGFSSATSSDISNYITTSDNEYSYNKFKIETTAGQPSSYEDMLTRNGCLQGTMTIIGHMKF